HRSRRSADQLPEPDVAPFVGTAAARPSSDGQRWHKRRRFAMSKMTSASALSIIALGAILALLPGGPAQALNAKSWLSNTGNDANDCTLAHPCATFQRAHDLTASGGEIGVLTPGDYVGPTITKSIHITNDGTGEATIATGVTNTAIFIS